MKRLQAVEKQLLLGASLLIVSVACACTRRHDDQTQKRIVRIAELEVDAAQLENYKAALKEEIETCIRVEPGVLTLYALSVKGTPTKIRIFETYADVEAYQTHLRTAHFQK